jgi:hypothetical protein
VLLELDHVRQSLASLSGVRSFSAGARRAEAFRRGSRYALRSAENGSEEDEVGLLASQVSLPTDAASVSQLSVTKAGTRQTSDGHLGSERPVTTARQDE